MINCCYCCFGMFQLVGGSEGGKGTFEPGRGGADL